MNKLIVILVFLNILSISYQIECSSFRDATCEGHNSNYTLKCHKFGTNDCEEIEIDDGCQIDSSNACVVKSGETLPQGEKCYNHEDRNKCRRVKDQCTSYKNSNCGGHIKIENSTQCIQLSSSEYCSLIELDNYCEVDSNGKCSKKSGLSASDFDDSKDVCDFNTGRTACKKRDKVCSDQDITNCKGFSLTDPKQKCSKVNGKNLCQIIEIDNSCEINASGNCIVKSGVTDKKCAFQNSNTACKESSKVCSDYELSKCSSFPSSGGKTCSNVGEDYCKEVQIGDLCKIESGECVLKTASDTTVCEFSDEKTICDSRNKICSDYASTECANSGNQACHKVENFAKCKEVRVDGECTINTSGKCSLIDQTDQDSICEFSTRYDQCIFRTKICGDYTSTDCNSKEGCSYFEDRGCIQVTTDSNCKIQSEECIRDEEEEDAQFSENEECLFDYLKKDCRKRTKQCSIYFENNCGDIEITDTKQCKKLSDSNYCKEITVDTNCKVNDVEECVSRADDFSESTGICVFDNEGTKSSCTLRPRSCNEYTTNACESLTPTSSNIKCFHFSSSCHEVELDDYCTVEAGECKTKSGVSLTANEKCAFTDYKKTECKKRNLYCNEYTEATCVNIPETKNSQCYKFNTRCQEVELDDYCHVNGSGKCVAKGEGQLTENEICAFNGDSKTKCKKSEKTCEDLDDNTCESYTLTSKLCFKLEGFESCKEVETDDSCQMNSSNECVPKGSLGKHEICTLDETSDKCYKKKTGDASLLSLKLFSLLLLFFIN